MQTGRNAALEGAEVLIALRNSELANTLHQPWQSVLADPLVNPTQATQDIANPNLGSEYAAIKTLFLQKRNAPALIEALDQGGAYGYNITNSRGQARPQSTSLYASGDDFVLMDGNGAGKAYIAGTWSDVDRSNLTRVNNRDGTVDLNINRNGTTERLLHVDPSATVLRSTQQQTQADQQSWEPFLPNQPQEVSPAVNHRNIDSPQPLSAPQSDPQSSSTGDPDLDRLAAALYTGNDAALSQAAARIAQSEPVQAFERWSHDLLAWQQQQDHQQALDRQAQERQQQDGYAR